MVNLADQNMINTVVDGTLSATLTDEQEIEYINASTPYDDLYTEREPSYHSWIRDGQQFARGDFPDWESYLDEDWFVEIGFTKKQLSHWSSGNKPSIEEYRTFLKSWIKQAFETFDWAIYPIASFHVLYHEDGRQCICVLASTEGGQGGWEFEDVYEGLVPTADVAIALLKEVGIVDTYSESELDAFIERVAAEENMNEQSPNYVS